MSRREHQQTKRLIQQRQEQQRDRPTSTAKTSGGGVGGQHRQGVTVQFQPATRKPSKELGLLTVVDSFPIPAPHEAPSHIPTPAARRALDDLGVHVPEGCPPLQSVREALDARLAPLPRHGEPLSPAQGAALDLLAQLAGDLAHRITDPASVHALIDRLPDLGTGCGRAVAQALREAQ